MSGHTPGPWRCYLDANGEQWVVDSDANADHLLVVSFGPQTNRYSEANARLIAAAPDLLAACWSTIQYLEKRADCESNDLWGEVSAAYRKAIGNRDSG